jgi:hypothetical protein
MLNKLKLILNVQGTRCENVCKEEDCRDMKRAFNNAYHSGRSFLLYSFFISDHKRV